MYNAYTYQCAHRFVRAIQPAYTVGLVTTGLSQSAVAFILFPHPSAPLRLLSSFNLNSACFPQCAVHRSHVLHLSVIVCLLLLRSLALFLKFTLRSSTWRIKGYISFIPVCVLLSLKMTLPRRSLSNQRPMEGDKGQLPCLAHFNWQLHAGPSERRLQGMEPGSNALLKCVKRTPSCCSQIISVS